MDNAHSLARRALMAIGLMVGRPIEVVRDQRINPKQIVESLVADANTYLDWTSRCGVPGIAGFPLNATRPAVA